MRRRSFWRRWLPWPAARISHPQHPNRRPHHLSIQPLSRHLPDLSERQKAGTNALSDVVPFVNVARQALKDGFEVSNYRPSAVAFDYDNDGDQDLYVTSNAENSNYLYSNLGGGTFANLSQEAGVDLFDNNSSGAVACDLNNDGYKDLYVGARGIIGDGLDFRSATGIGVASRHLRKATRDHLFLNNQDGTFTDISDSALGEDVNLRSASSIACADVDGDGWLDFYVGNAIDEDWFIFDQTSHPGHYNLLYVNNGDLTFTEMASSVGVQGLQITLRDPDGEPILFTDPETGREYEGYDPTITDAGGNQVGDPSGRTHAVLFFDHDDDGDPDLWVANDGHRPYVFRNDSSPGDVRFTPVAEAMGIDESGNWMSFAVGDYDGDEGLDVFVTNVGYHLRLFPLQEEPGGDCRYTERFPWGTCLHYLLRNDGTRDVAGLGVVGLFTDVAAETDVAPSPLMPPRSLDRKRIHPDWDAPTGLAAYDFGYGTTFFDYDNDGDQDLYWLGSEGPPGQSSYPAAGRMLRGDGQGGFEDITVRAHLLDIADVDYSVLDADDPAFNPDRQRISNRFNLNGKALAHADLNGDGYLDLVGTNSSGPVWDSLSNSYTPGARPPVRLDERRRRQPLDFAATQGPHEYRWNWEQRRRGRGSSLSHVRRADAGAGGARRFQLPIHGQHRAGVRFGSGNHRGRDQNSLAKRTKSGSERRRSGPDTRNHRA